MLFVQNLFTQTLIWINRQVVLPGGRGLTHKPLATCRSNSDFLSYSMDLMYHCSVSHCFYWFCFTVIFNFSTFWLVPLPWMLFEGLLLSVDHLLCKYCIVDNICLFSCCFFLKKNHCHALFVMLRFKSPHVQFHISGIKGLNLLLGFMMTKHSTSKCNCSSSSSIPIFFFFLRK